MKEIRDWISHAYNEKPHDIISKQFHPTGALYLYNVLNNGIPANGWSTKKYFPAGELQEEENYSNGLLIEKISYNENGVITEHKIWNNRLRQLIDKPVYPKLRKLNFVTGHASLSKYLKNLQEVSTFIRADYKEDSFLRSYDTSITTSAENAAWTMKGEQISFTVYWDHDEISHQWHCHCDTEELYWKARIFLETIF